MTPMEVEGHMLATQAAVRILIAGHQNPGAAALLVQREVDSIIALARGARDGEFRDALGAAKSRLLPNDATPRVPT